LGSIELTASKIASDNNRLREKVLEVDADQESGLWKDDKIAELEFLLGEYKKRNDRNPERRCFLCGSTDYTEKSGPETDLTSLHVEKAVLSKRTKEMEKSIQNRDSEVQHLQSLLGEQVVSNIPNPTARLIYLEEYSRNLEQVTIPQASL
jgi:hypothetical protein